MADSNSADSNSGTNAELAKFINDEVNKALSGALRRIDLEGKINKSLETALGTLKTSPSEAPEEETKVSLKTLKDEIESLKRGKKEAEQRAIDQSMRSEVKSVADKVFGAENPHLPAYLAKAYDVDKRFVQDSSGQTVMKFKGEFGDELLSVEEGLSKLAQSEWKALKSSPLNGLPPNLTGLAKGQRYVAQTQGTQGMDPTRAALLSKLYNPEE